MIEPADCRMAADLHALAAATFPLACPPVLEPEPINRFISQKLSVKAFEGYLAESQAQILVGRETTNGQLVGYTLVLLKEPDNPQVAAMIGPRPAAELSKCYTLANYHGSGLAKALGQAAIAGAAQAGMVSMWLGVHQENRRAQRFYGKLGFRRLGVRRFDVGDRQMDDYVMGASLVDLNTTETERDR